MAVIGRFVNGFRRAFGGFRDGLRGQTRNPLQSQSGRIVGTAEEIANSAGRIMSAPARALGISGPILAGVVGVAVLYVAGRTFLPNVLPVVIDESAEKAAMRAEVSL